MTPRDYSLFGEDGRRAVETGLASAEWYHTDVPRREMKAMMQRTDGPAIRDTIIWLAALIVFAGLGIALWPSWWFVPALLKDWLIATIALCAYWWHFQVLLKY